MLPLLTVSYQTIALKKVVAPQEANDIVRHLDLFSGIGGFALAARRVGWETVAFCEIDPYCQRVLAKHWPGVPIHSDIKELSGESIGPVDIVTGGFPCKQTSLAAAITGNRHGLDGADSGLWWEYLRLVRTIRPLWVIVENPLGVGKWADTIQAGLEGLGYRVSMPELASRDCGAPHIRRRLFFVANRDSEGLPITWQADSSPAADVAGTPFAGRIGDPSQPRVLRVDARVSSRVDRITAIGNSCDPRVAEVILRTIDSQFYRKISSQ